VQKANGGKVRILPVHASCSEWPSFQDQPSFMQNAANGGTEPTSTDAAWCMNGGFRFFGQGFSSATHFHDCRLAYSVHVPRLTAEVKVPVASVRHPEWAFSFLPVKMSAT
jgi:hypothetical protein